jgi:hypothetical protein
MTDSVEDLVRRRRSESSDPQDDETDSVEWVEPPLRVEITSINLPMNDVFNLAIQIVLVQVLFGAAIAIVLYALGVFD